MDRILMVEDDAMMREVMQTGLEGAGYEVVACADAKSGLERAAAISPDLILLDVNLPDALGHDVCRTLRSDPRTRSTPIIMLTGEARSLELRVSGLDAGADDYLFKPISLKVLAARVGSLLKVRRNKK